MLIKDLIAEFFDRVGLPQDTPYVIGGGSGLYLRGLASTFRDLDLLVPALSRDRVISIPRTERTYVVDGVKDVEGLTQRILETQEMVEGFPVNSLEATLVVKKRLNRPKDAQVIAILETILARKNHG